MRWRRSADGKWLWKGDTSSDEITGHFFGYLVFYDLAADENDRVQVRAHVRKVMDGLIAGGYRLIDIDGKPTRWGNWSPDDLNRNPDWSGDRGLNCLEMLSFLKASNHITGDDQYRRHYLELLEKQGYGDLARRPRSLRPGERTHIDDELLALAIPAVALYETDPKLKTIYRDALAFWLPQIRNDHSPYFSFVYGAMSGAQSGEEFGLAAAVEFLRDTPLDLVEWAVDNSRREDLRLVRQPIVEVRQTDRMLPPSERGVMRWDNNPWAAVQGAGGEVESSGVFWLLPYWMGRYYGFIQSPK